MCPPSVRLQERPEVALKPVFTDMASAIATCHSAGVVHRDVKCENFVVAKRPGGRGFSVKLCDFGLASRTPRALFLQGRGRPGGLQRSGGSEMGCVYWAGIWGSIYFRNDGRPAP